MKKIHQFLSLFFCLVIFPSVIFSQDSTARSRPVLKKTPPGGKIDIPPPGYSKLPPPQGQSSSGTVPVYDKVPPVSGQTSSGLVPVYDKVPPLPGQSSAGTVPGYDKVPPLPGQSSSGLTPGYEKIPVPLSGYGKADGVAPSAATQDIKNPGYSKVPPPAKGLTRTPAVKSNLNVQAANASTSSAATNQYQQLPVKARNQPDNNLSSQQSTLSNAATNKNQYQQLPVKARNQPDNNLSSQQPALSNAATNKNQYGAPPVPGQAAKNNIYTAPPASPVGQAQQVNQNNAGVQQSTNVSATTGNTTPGSIKNTEAFKNVQSKLAPAQPKPNNTASPKTPSAQSRSAGRKSK